MDLRLKRGYKRFIHRWDKIVSQVDQHDAGVQFKISHLILRKIRERHEAFQKENAECRGGRNVGYWLPNAQDFEARVALMQQKMDFNTFCILFTSNVSIYNSKIIF